jgi:hypothetical protein
MKIGKTILSNTSTLLNAWFTQINAKEIIQKTKLVFFMIPSAALIILLFSYSSAVRKHCPMISAD